MDMQKIRILSLFPDRNFGNWILYQLLSAVAVHCNDPP